MAPVTGAHRPGAWKQSNKGHKTGGHRSKGMVEKENRGRVEGGSICGKKIKKVMGKAGRRHQQAQLRRAAKAEVAARKRAVGSSGAPPVLVGFVEGAIVFAVSSCYLEKKAKEAMKASSEVELRVVPPHAWK